MLKIMKNSINTTLQHDLVYILILSKSTYRL